MVNAIKAEAKSEFKCGICGAEYLAEPFGGYCDESLECAMSDGESLIKL